jgi:hypothetical protein
MKLNLSALLLILGGLGVFAPDVAAVAAWLSATHIAWLSLPVRILAFVATMLGALPLAIPRLRAFLALLGLATAPSSVTPSASGVAAQVYPLMDGSSVVQVTPPTPTSVSGVQPSLVSVAVDPSKVSPMPVAK